jgi:hypothetical protein
MLAFTFRNTEDFEGSLMAKKKRVRPDEISEDEMVKLTSLLGNIAQAIEAKDRGALDWAAADLMDFIGYETQLTFVMRT